MLKKLLAAVGIKSDPPEPKAYTGLYSPYPAPHVNFLYNLLFCDEPKLFNRDAKTHAGIWADLLDRSPESAKLLHIAQDQGNDGRVRAVAYNRLRALGETVQDKALLGVIIEVPLEQGLDTLAAFSDGGVRYLNQSGKVSVFEGGETPVAHIGKALLATARPVVDKIGPWEDERLAPPKPGNVRMTFLVSDGLYFGEGPYAILRDDDMAGPILSQATSLLQTVTQIATNQR